MPESTATKAVSYTTLRDTIKRAMKPRSLSLFGVLFCFAASVSLAGCGDPTYKWYQKMTVEVDTPDGVKVGSSVVSVERPWSRRNCRGRSSRR